MFPYIDVEQWSTIDTDVCNHILVSCLSIPKCFIFNIIAEPSPPGTLDSCCVQIEWLDEFVQRLPFFCDCCMQDTSLLWKLTVRWCAKRIPEEFMIKMTTCVEMNVLRKCNWSLQVTFSSSFCLLFKKIIEVGDVGSMMFAIMEIKKLSTHDGFEITNFIR